MPMSKVWQRSEDLSWAQTWWKNWPELDKCLASKSIDFSVSDVVEELSSGSNAFGKALQVLYIRTELVYIFQRLEALYNAAKTSGVILTGQPGTGKTIALLFFLLCQLAAGHPVMYTKALQTTYFFDGQTVWEAETAKLKSRDVPGGRRNEPPVWSLIDSDASTFEPPDALLAYTFPIHAVSPNETRFKNWRKQNLAYRIIMDPWNLEDLLGWAQIDPRLQTYELDYQAMQNLVKLCGPVPRDIIGELIGRSTETSVSSELQKLTLPQLWKHLADITTSPADTSHKLIIISRYLNGRYEDNFVTDFKSLRVAELVYEKWRVLGEEEALLFYQLCRGNAKSSFLAGWVFESLAINYTSSEPLSKQVLLPLRVMCATSENLSYTDASTVPDPSPMEYDVLHVNTEGAGLQRADGTLIFRISPLALGSLVAHSRDIIHYTDITKQPFSNHHLYVPKARNNLLFDAFFIDINDTARTIVLWILQITASKRHEGSSNGYPIIRKLKDRLAGDRRGYKIQLKYVLVVPVLKCQVSWQLPEGWGPDVAGEVLVQYVDTTLAYTAVHENVLRVTTKLGNILV